MKLDVPYFKQDTAYSCGAAAVQMLLRFFGVVASEGELVRQLHTDKSYGTHHHSIREELTNRGFYCYVNTDGELEEVRHFVRQGVPVLVHYLEPDENEGHYAVVVGFESGHIILNDPWHGEGYALTEASFIARWRDEKNAFPCWFLVTQPEPFSIGHHYAPRKHVS